MKAIRSAGRVVCGVGMFVAFAVLCADMDGATLGAFVASKAAALGGLAGLGMCVRRLEGDAWETT